jgi:putative aldouronate transport system permease protein
VKSYKNKIKRTTGEVIFDTFNYIFMFLMAVVMIYPFWYVLVLALNNGVDAANGPIWFWPRKFTLENFQYVLKYPGLKEATFVTVMRCLIAPVFSVTVNMMAAYALSKRFLPWRKAIIFFLMGPMFIGGTVVSHYVVIAKLGLLNRFLVFILPGAFGYFTAVIMRSFIDGIPLELQESAMLDGAGYWTIFTKIIIPLSKPCLAAFLFFSLVGNWLDLNTNLLYITKRSLSTLQYLMYIVITSNEARNIIDISSTEMQQRFNDMNSLTYQPPTPQVIKMAIMVIVTFPMLFIYPFFQKYFVKGMLTGSVKA